MASLFKSSAIRNITRSFAAQTNAAHKPKEFALPIHQPEVSTLGNGIIVASLENNSPISNIGILFKSGARYEEAGNLGVSHMLRICAGLATKNHSYFAITRVTQQLGASIFCENGREHIFYGMNLMRDNFVDGMKLLNEVATRTCFKHWEVDDQKPRLLYDLAVREPISITLDMLHTAAYHNSGLGNSLFLSKYRVGKITPEMLREFTSRSFKGPRMAVVGLGVDHSQLVRLFKKLDIESGEGANVPSSTYVGGELREDTSGPLAYVAIAGPGASFGSTDAASFAIAQSILGSGPGTKYGSNASSKLAAAISSAGGLGYASSINVNYSDGGLFGFFLVEEASKAADVLRACVKTVSKLKVTETDVNQAKVRVKGAILMGTESSRIKLEDLGLQALWLRGYTSPSDYLASIDKVTASSVEKALATMLKGKPSMSAYGGISQLPYLDQL